MTRRTIYALVLLLLLSTRQSSAMLPPLLPAPLIHGRAIVGMLQFQEKPAPATNGAPTATTPAPVDNEEQVILLREQLLQTRKNAAIQPQLIAFQEQMLKQVNASPEVVAEEKAIADLKLKFGERKVREAGKDPKTHTWNGKEAVEKPKPVPVAEKPKVP